MSDAFSAWCTDWISSATRQSEMEIGRDAHRPHNIPQIRPLTLVVVAFAITVAYRRRQSSISLPLSDDDAIKQHQSDSTEDSTPARVRDTSQINLDDDPEEVFCANMARVNNRPSTIASSRANTAAPPSSNASDQENYDPQRDPRRDKRPATMDSPPDRASLPTPSSEEAVPSSTAHKRKRGQATQGEDVEEDDGDSEGDSDDQEMKKFTRYYDPNQDRKKRQQVKRKSRKLDREIIGELW